MKQVRVSAEHGALGPGRQALRALSRIALVLRAHTTDAFVTEDEDSAMAIRKVTGGTGAAIRVTESHRVPDPHPGAHCGPAERLRRRGVLILSPDNCTVGGIQRYTWTWGEVALDLGYPVRIATVWKKGTRNGVGVSRIHAAWFTVKATVSALIHRPAVVISAHLSLSPVAKTIKRITGAPYAVTLHGNEAWRGEFGRVTERAIRDADLLIPVSHFTREIVAEMLDMAPGKFYVTGGLLAPELQLGAAAMREAGEVAADPERPVLLTVARLDLNSPYKRHDLVLRAIAELAPEYPDLTYHVVGDGPYRQNLEALASELKIADRVKFLGRISERELARENATAYASVMPSRISLKPSEGEGFGLVYLEAGIYGVPSIAANGGGSTETVLDGITGILVESDSLESLVAGIRKLLDDPALRDRLGKAAPRRAAEFSYPIFRRKCAAVIAALTDGTDPRSIEPEHDPRAPAPWA